jgi:hypothetical protein
MGVLPDFFHVSSPYNEAARHAAFAGRGARRKDL